VCGVIRAVANTRAPLPEHTAPLVKTYSAQIGGSRGADKVFAKNWLKLRGWGTDGVFAKNWLKGGANPSICRHFATIVYLRG